MHELPGPRAGAGPGGALAVTGPPIPIVSTIFKFDPNTQNADLQTWLHDFDSAFGHIYHPEPLRLLYDCLQLVPEDRPALRYSVYTVLDQLSRRTHRNHSIISSLGVTRSLFQAYHAAKDDVSTSKEEQYVLQKLLKRIVDVGLTTDDARLMFQKAVRPDDTLDINVLEILRAGTKVNWPDHFSLKSPASFEVSCESVRSLPTTGFTFMVWHLSCTYIINQYRCVIRSGYGSKTSLEIVLLQCLIFAWTTKCYFHWIYARVGILNARGRTASLV